MEPSEHDLQTRLQEVLPGPLAMARLAGISEERVAEIALIALQMGLLKVELEMREMQAPELPVDENALPDPTQPAPTFPPWPGAPRD